jgi:hypothetical protein
MSNLSRPRFWLSVPGCLTFFAFWIAVTALVATIDLGGRAMGILPTLEPTATPTITPTSPPTPIPTATPVLLAPAGPTPAPTPVPATSAPLPTDTPVPYGISFAQACEVNEDDMTDPQIDQHAASTNGLTFTGWRGWVYNVSSRFGGGYDLEIAMEPRGLFWGRDIVVENIPAELTTLAVEQEVVFDGRIARNEVSFRIVCNPLRVDQFVLVR